MKLGTGPDIQSPVHPEEIPTGEVQCVSQTVLIFTGPLSSFSGLPINFLLVESLQRFYQYYGTDLQVPFCPFTQCYIRRLLTWVIVG